MVNTFETVSFEKMLKNMERQPFLRLDCGTYQEEHVIQTHLYCLILTFRREKREPFCQIGRHHFFKSQKNEIEA